MEIIGLNSRTGKQLSALDENNRFSCKVYKVYFLKQKFEVFTKVKLWKAEVERIIHVKKSSICGQI